MYSDRSQYIKVRELFKAGNISRAETIPGNTVVYKVKLYIELPSAHSENRMNNDLMIKVD